MPWTLADLEERLMMSSLVRGSTLTDEDRRAVLAGRTVANCSVVEMREVIAHQRPEGLRIASSSTLSHVLDDPRRIDALKEAIASDRFPGVTLAHAILFARSGGLLPASDLPVQSFLDLDDWLRADAV